MKRSPLLKGACKETPEDYQDAMQRVNIGLICVNNLASLFSKPLVMSEELYSCSNHVASFYKDTPVVLGFLPLEAEVM